LSFVLNYNRRAVAQIRPFRPVKLMCGIIASEDAHFVSAEAGLAGLFGDIDSRSARFDFNITNYYEAEMGPSLRRGFLSFERLVDPEQLSDIKVKTNEFEDDVRLAFGATRRVVNIDPGFLTSAALIMATAKDFSHRIPLRRGIYGHLELLFSKNGLRRLDWTYPDFAQEGYQVYFLDVRKIYLAQLRTNGL
jgi:hypothetical protein